MLRHTHRAFWSLYCVIYDAAWDSPLTREVVAAAVLGISPGTSVIDIGCGTGLSSRALVERGVTVTGVDGVKAMVSRAMRTHRVSGARVADAASTGLPSGSAGAVLSINVLHVHPQPRAVLAEMVRLVSPQGALVIVFPTDGADASRVFAADRATGRGWVGSGLAVVLRRLIAFPAWLTRLPRNSEAILAEATAEATAEACRINGLSQRSDQVMFGCQRVIRIAFAAAPPGPERQTRGP